MTSAVASKEKSAAGTRETQTSAETNTSSLQQLQKGLASTTTQKIRASMNGELRSSLDHFIQFSTPEERYFLNGVFITWASQYCSSVEGDIAIASAFEDEIQGYSHHLVIEDEELFEATLQFIKERKESKAQ